MIIIDPAITSTDSRNPRVGWHTVLTAANVAASDEDASFPAANLANTLTYLPWKAEGTSAQTLTVSIGAATLCNYIAIARHNFGSGGITFTVESSDDGSAWTTRVSTVTPEDDHVIIVEFPDVTAAYFRLSLTPSSTAPQAAILYLGEILRVQRRIYVGHTPLPLGRDTEVSSGFSEDGQFLGRVQRRQTFGTQIELQNLEADWYRTYMDPFIDAATLAPFFFAWRGDDYQDEGALCWLTSDPKPKNQRANGMMQVSLNVQGLR